MSSHNVHSSFFFFWEKKEEGMQEKGATCATFLV